MTWNHSIIKRDLKKPVYYAVHEVFYNDVGEITSWTSEPIDLTADSPKEILEILKQITADIKLAVLNEKELIRIVKSR